MGPFVYFASREAGGTAGRAVDQRSLTESGLMATETLTSFQMRRRRRFV